MLHGVWCLPVSQITNFAEIQMTVKTPRLKTAKDRKTKVTTHTNSQNQKVQDIRQPVQSQQTYLRGVKRIYSLRPLIPEGSKISLQPT
jgi:hypothetical protein